MNKPVCIIGGGVAGMQVALVLSSLGMPSVLVEKSAALGGRVPRLSRTFPFFNNDGFNDGKEFTDGMEQELRATPLVDVRLSTQVRALHDDFPNFAADLSDGTSVECGAVVVATAKGGLGTGNGLGGGVVAMIVGMIGITLGWLALTRSRRRERLASQARA